MSLLRKDPLSYAWVIFSEENYEHDAGPGAGGFCTPQEDCPFCPGHEHRTPPEIQSLRAAGTVRDSAGWSVRTVPNQFAVLHIEGKLDKRGEGLYDMMNGIGAHEVVVESPDHDALFHDFPIEKITEILWMYRERHQDLSLDPRFRYIQVFRNYGELAGAQISHPHSQIIALPIIPRAAREQILHAYDYWRMKERCIFCDILAQDSPGPRLVYENEAFVVLEPFAAKLPFETWIYPREHLSTFWQMPESQLPALADALKVTTTALAGALGNLAYNLILHSAPLHPEKNYHNAQAKVPDYYHWHIELMPRTMNVAGFEFGTGGYINSVLPETSAGILKKQIAEARGVGETDLI